MFKYKETELHASGAETADGNGTLTDTFPEYDTGDPSAYLAYAPDVRFYLDVSDHAGTSPTLDVTIEGLVGGVWVELGAFTQVVETDGSESILVVGCPQTMREVHAITGSAGQSYTFTVNCSR